MRKEYYKHGSYAGSIHGAVQVSKTLSLIVVSPSVNTA